MFVDVITLNNKRTVFINARIQQTVILTQSYSHLIVDPTTTEDFTLLRKDWTT